MKTRAADRCVSFCDVVLYSFQFNQDFIDLCFYFPSLLLSCPPWRLTEVVFLFPCWVFEVVDSVRLFQVVCPSSYSMFCFVFLLLSLTSCLCGVSLQVFLPVQCMTCFTIRSNNRSIDVSPVVPTVASLKKFSLM